MSMKVGKPQLPTLLDELKRDLRQQQAAQPSPTTQTNAFGGEQRKEQARQLVNQSAGVPSPSLAQRSSLHARGAQLFGQSGQATQSADTSVTVRRGDTLSHIAQRHGTTWQELARYNNLDNPHLIHPGQQIRIPSGQSTQPSAPAAPTQPSSPAAPGTPGTNGSTAPQPANPTAPTAPTTPAQPGGPVSRDQAIDRLIDYTAQTEGGGRYDAWNPNDNGAGVSYGLIQFNQKRGSLPSLMQRMHQTNPEKFNQIFGPHAGNMQNPSWVRNADLNNPDIKNRMLQAGADPEFQKVQRDLAREGYFDPTDRLAEQYGIQSERGRAMLFDTAVQYGVGGLGDKLASARNAVGANASERDLLGALADRADTHGYDHNRRHRILNDPRLSDAPLGQGGVGSTAGASGATPYSDRNVHDGGSSYVVRNGDSLSRIAGTLGTSWQELYELNKDTISDPNRIYPGQVLRLPGGTSAPGGATPAPGGAAPGAQGPNGPAAVNPNAPAGGANNALQAALSQLGVREDAGRDEDRNGRIREYRNSVTAPGYRQNRGPEPWCADFVSWAHKQAGRPLGPNGEGFAYVPYMKKWLQDSGQWHPKGNYQPQPGDIVVFNWDGGRPDHVGMVESVNGDGSINTVEGNAPDGVHRRRRTLGTIEGFGHLN